MTTKSSAKGRAKTPRKQKSRKASGSKNIDAMMTGLEPGWITPSSYGSCMGVPLPFGGNQPSPAWSIEKFIQQQAIAWGTFDRELRARAVSFIGDFAIAPYAVTDSVGLPSPITPYISLWVVSALWGAVTTPTPQYFSTAGSTQDDSIAYGAAQSVFGINAIKAIKRVQYCNIRPMWTLSTVMVPVVGQTQAFAQGYKIHGILRVPAKWHKAFHATSAVGSEYESFLMILVRYGFPNSGATNTMPDWSLSGRSRIKYSETSVRELVDDVLA